MTYFFREKFGIEEGKLGSLFFTTSIISACSMLVASSLAKRFGNVKVLFFNSSHDAVVTNTVPSTDNGIDSFSLYHLSRFDPRAF